MAEEENGDAPAFPVIRAGVEQGEHTPFMKKSGEGVQEAASRGNGTVILPASEGFDSGIAVLDKDLSLAFPFVH